MVGEKTTGQQWELEIMEKLAAVDEAKLLDIVLHSATSLCYWLSQVKAGAEAEEITDSETEEMLLNPIGRTAVLLDVLQMRYGDASEYELAFLQNIEEACQ